MSEPKDKNPPPPEPRDVVDGVPDRTPRPAAWKYLLLALIFLLWVALLLAVVKGWL